MAENTNDGRTPLIVQSKLLDPTKHPNLESIQSAILASGDRSSKEVKYTTVRNPGTGTVHHHALNIHTIRKARGGETVDDKHSISLSDENGDDQIGKLTDFLLDIRTRGAATETGKHVLVHAPAEFGDGQELQSLLLKTSAGGKADALASVLAKAQEDPAVVEAILQRASDDPLIFVEAAAILRLGAYKQAIKRLEELISNNAAEKEFQALLTLHPWMFGSEYSELLDRRRWTRDENQDFVLRRTADDFIELTEIKTPLNGSSLFLYDSSHDCYYQSADVSKVLGQVQHYLCKLDADRNTIRAEDKEDTIKIRAKVIIGRDGNEKQQLALRVLNGHLHRIEIITFDQLLRIANRVVSYLESAISPTPAAT